MQRVGYSTSTNTTINVPTGAKIGDTAILVCRKTNNFDFPPSGWTQVAGMTDRQSMRVIVCVRKLESIDPVTTQYASHQRMEVWSQADGTTTSAIGGPVAGPVTTKAIPEAPAGSLGFWVFVSNRLGNSAAATPPAGINGGTNNGLGIFYGEPTTSPGIPAVDFPNATGISNELFLLTIAFHPGAPPYNLFRIDAVGETGLTPALLGASAVNDVPLRWVP